MDNTPSISTGARQPLMAGAMFLGTHPAGSTWNGFWLALFALLAWPVLLVAIARLRTRWRQTRRGYRPRRASHIRLKARPATHQVSPRLRRVK